MINELSNLPPFMLKLHSQISALRTWMRTSCIDQQGLTSSKQEWFNPIWQWGRGILAKVSFTFILTHKFKIYLANILFFIIYIYIYGFILLWPPFLGLPMSSFHGQVFGSQIFQKKIISFQNGPYFSNQEGAFWIQGCHSFKSQEQPLKMKLSTLKILRAKNLTMKIRHWQT